MNSAVKKLLKDRYFLKEEKTWNDVAKRVSGIYPKIYEYIRDMIFIPGSPTLMNLNTNGERKGTLSSCFILDIKDDIHSIMDTMKDSAIIQKNCGGVGINWSKLRGSNEIVKSFNRTSGGPLSFIGIFDAILDGVKQGSARRGAGMSLFDIYHPDILKFINAKKDRNRYTRSNFSVKIPNKFYKILEKDPGRIFKTIDIVDKKENILEDKNGEKITYKKLWDYLIENSWEHAEPGIFNGDIALERCTCSHISTNVSSNPCAEYTHIPYTSCNLGSINLANTVQNGTEMSQEDFYKLIRLVTRYMNKIVDKNHYPLKKIEEETLKARPIGIGIMGLAHLFYKLKLPYNSIEANDLAKKIVRTMTLTAMRESVIMAKEKGKSYEYFDYKTFMDANSRFWGEDTKELEADIKKYGCYNSSETSIAPTGSISFIADTTGGIEPCFGLVFSRKIETGNKIYETAYVVDPIFEEHVSKNYRDKKEKIYKYISKNNGSCQGCLDISEEDQKIFVVAGDLTADEHLNILEVVSNNISLSSSKTINLPAKATKEDISNVFLEAYKRGVIGVTVYRQGSRDSILFHEKNIKLERPERVTRTMAPRRPKDLLCDIYDISVVGKRYIILIGLLHDSLYELFLTVDKQDKIDLEKHKKGIIRKRKQNTYDLLIVENEKEEILIDDIGDTFDIMDSSLSRLVSMALRHGTPLQFICEQLEQTRNFGGFSRAAQRILKRYIKDGEEILSKEKCPECDGKMVYCEGCKTCTECGWSKCS